MRYEIFDIEFYGRWEKYDPGPFDSQRAGSANGKPVYISQNILAGDARDIAGYLNQAGHGAEYVGSHMSTRMGAPTLDINTGSVIYKIRVQSLVDQIPK